MTESPLLFFPKEAQEYGVDEAIMLQNFRFWITKNTANRRSRHQGRTWTYNSQEAFCRMYPFWSRRQIQRILGNLVERGVLITGNFNQKANDRTVWYAFVDEQKFLPELGPFDGDDIAPNGAMKDSAGSVAEDSSKPAEKLIAPNGANDSTVSCDPLHQTVRPLPRYNQDITKGETRTDVRATPPDSIDGSKKLVQSKAYIVDLLQRRRKGEPLDADEKADIEAWEAAQKELGRAARGTAAEPADIEEPLPALPPGVIDGATLRAWEERILPALKQRHGEQTYRSWLKPMVLHRAATQEVVFTVATPFIRRWILGNYAEEMLRAFQPMGYTSVAVMVRQPEARP